ncbi:MAG: hypothetical protein IJ055_06995 [Oscillospiraceae bacterium]|nr:hypothetical protein [Oscillospiraceae bacterium]
MKRTAAVLPVLAAGLLLSSCTPCRTDRQGEGTIDTQPAPVSPVTCDLSGSGADGVTRVTLEGELPAGTRILDVYGTNVLHSEVVGRFGAPVEIDSGDLHGAQLTFFYDPDAMHSVPPGNLLMLHYNEEEDFYDSVDTSLDTDAHTVSAAVSEPGVYLLTDAYVWYSAWGVDDAQDYAHDTVYEDREFGFSIRIPQEIRLRYVSDYLREDEEGYCKTLLECEQNDSIQIGIEYIDRPYYDSPTDYMNELAGALDQNGYLSDTGVIREQPDTVGYYFYADFGDNANSVNCIFPLTDTQYINVWYGFTDPERFEDVRASLESFVFTGTPTLPAAPEGFDFSNYKDTNGMNISITLPDGLQTRPVVGDWECIYKNGEIIQADAPVREVAGDLPEEVLSLSIKLEESPYNAKNAAQEALRANISDDDRSAVSTKHILTSGGQDGYLLRIRDEKEGTDWLYGYYDIEGSHQYIRVTAAVRTGTEQAEAYWNALWTVNTNDPDRAVTSKDLVISFPEDFSAVPADWDWGRESDYSGRDYYRAWLLETDHEACRKAGNTVYCGAFFYLIDTGRTAQKDAAHEKERLLNNKNLDYRLEREEELTMPCGGKGYLFCLRPADAPENVEYGSCYLYGYYEIPGSEQYVQIEYMLNEPLDPSDLDAYWNSLRSVDLLVP